jgi:hypothetical protein
MKSWLILIICCCLSVLIPGFVFAGWFGLEDCPSHWAVATGYADACRFQAPEEGTSTRLEIRTWSYESPKTTFRMAVYNDQSGRPGSKLWEGTDLAYTAGEWCGEDVETIQLTKDAYFWFAFKTAAEEEMCYVGSGPVLSHEWKTGQAYADTFPNPWGSYSGSNANRYTMRMYYEIPTGGRGIIEIDAGAIEGGFVR